MSYDKEQADADQAMHKASRDVRLARDEADRARSRAAARQPKKLTGEKPGTVRTDGIIVMPEEEGA